MNKSFWVAAGIVGVIVAIIAALSFGGPEGGGSADASGDVALGEGADAPQDPSLADVSGAEVRREDGKVIFEVTMAKPVPPKVRNGSLEFRWDVSKNGEDTWIVSANLNIGPTAAVTSQKTNYGASTIDGTMPGDIDIDGNVLRVIVRVGEIEGFPQTFNWRLTTTLDGDRANPRSATATDTAPDSGAGEVIEEGSN